MASILPCTCRATIRQAASAFKPRRATSAKRFSVQATHSYPRQATPFRASTSQSSAEAEPENSPEPWYMRESPIASTSSSQSTSPLEAPLPPIALPPYLHPLWTHLFEAPFLDQATIKFIDARAADLDNMHDGNDSMDASVTSWVDWTIIASLRNGRERGIRGASDGVKAAMAQSLLIFDEPAISDPSVNPTKRKRSKPKILIEGLDVAEPQWCLVDGGKAVVHIMTCAARDTWDVEGVATGFAKAKLKPKVLESVRDREDVQMAREEAV